MSATTRPNSAFCSRCRRKSSVRLLRTSRTWSTRISCRSRGKRQAGVGACRGCGSFLSLRTERCRSTAGLSVCPQVPACGRRVVAWRVRDAVTVVSRPAACDESFGSARRHVRPPRLASRTLAEWLPFVGHLATTRVPGSRLASAVSRPARWGPSRPRRLYLSVAARGRWPRHRGGSGRICGCGSCSRYTA